MKGWLNIDKYYYDILIIYKFTYYIDISLRNRKPSDFRSTSDGRTSTIVMYYTIDI